MKSVWSYVVSGRRSAAESILQPPILASVSSFVGRRVSFTRPVLQSVSSFRGPGVSLTHLVLESVLSFVGRGISLTRPVLVCVRLGSVGSFSYTFRHGICLFVRPRRSSGGEFLLHAPCWTLSGLSSDREPYLIRPLL